MINEMFQDGLPNHPKVEKVDFETVFPRWGNVLFPPTPVKEIQDKLASYDLIFLQCDIADSQGNLIGSSNWSPLIENLKLWDRVIALDVKDDQTLVKQFVNKPLVYFKRSYDKKFIPEGNTKVLPLAYAILDEYYDAIPWEYYNNRDHPVYSPHGRDIAVLCTLPQCFRGVPRDNLVAAIKKYDWGLLGEKRQNHNIQVTLAYTCGWLYSSTSVWFRHPRDFEFPQVNWWYIYMHLMHRAQIVFTASSHSAICDIRTWEAFSSGALVCIDFIDVPMPHPFIPGEHFLKLDVKDFPGTFEKAKELLDDNTERERIAMAGYEHGKKYHSVKARMDYVFEEIEKRM